MLFNINDYSKEFTDKYLYYFNRQEVKYVYMEDTEELVQTFQQVVKLITDYNKHFSVLTWPKYSSHDKEIMLKVIVNNFKSNTGFFILPTDIIKDTCNVYKVTHLETNYYSSNIQFIVFNICLSICRAILDIYENHSDVIQEELNSDYLYLLMQSFNIENKSKLLLNPLQLSFNRNVTLEYRKWTFDDIHNL